MRNVLLSGALKNSSLLCKKGLKWVVEVLSGCLASNRFGSPTRAPDQTRPDLVKECLFTTVF